MTKAERRQPMSLAGFLGHKSGSGGGTSRLKNWKDDGEITLWLHTQAMFAAVWHHPFPRIVSREDKQTGDKWQEVWPGEWNCLEEEDVLKNQYRRKDGERTHAPDVCPLCRFVEEIRRQVGDGELSIAAPVLNFEISGPKKNDPKVGSKVLTAGGIFNAFSENNMKNLSPKQTREMKRAGISRREAWKENLYAKCGYIFVVVNHADAGSGIVVAQTNTSLGDKMKEAIRDQMVSQGEEDGNPMLNPYAFRWQYMKNESQFDKKYKVIPMTKLKLPPAVKKLIVEEKPPAIDHMLAPGNVKTLRAVLEDKLVKGIEIDFDEIFGPAEALADANGVIGGDSSTEFDPEKMDAGDDAVNSLKSRLSGGEEDEEDEEDEEEETETGDGEEDEEETEAGDECEEEEDEESEEEEEGGGDDEDDEDDEDEDSDIVACTKCGEDMGRTDSKCGTCGVEYDAKGNMIEPAPRGKKKGKKRGAKKVPSRAEQDAAVAKGGDKFPF